MRRACLCTAIALTACVENEEPDSILRLTWIDVDDSHSVMIDAPQVAPLGANIPVVITTYRGGCVTRDRTDIVLAVDSADIVPYDREQLGEACPLVLITDPREEVVRFDTPGVKTIRVHGQVAYAKLTKIVELAIEIRTP